MTDCIPGRPGEHDWEPITEGPHVVGQVCTQCGTTVGGDPDRVPSRPVPRQPARHPDRDPWKDPA